MLRFITRKAIQLAHSNLLRGKSHSLSVHHRRHFPTMKENTRSQFNLRLKINTYCTALFFACSAIPSQAEIFFLAKTVGPASSIYSKDTVPGSRVNHITDNPKWRDLAFDIGQDHIVFMSNRHEQEGVDLRKQGEQFNIFIMPRAHPSTTEKNTLQPRVIADSPYDETHPRLDSTESKIIYRLKEPNKETLILHHLKDSKVRPLVSSDVIVDYQWHPNTNKIAAIVATGNETQLIEIDLDRDKTEVRLTLDAKQQGALSYVSWSPDGNRLAYIINPGRRGEKRALHLLDLHHLKTKLISKPELDVQQPVSWSPNGRSIVFSALKDYQFFYDETTYKKVYKGGMQIFLWNENTKLKQLTQGESLHNKPVFSPDGKHIAYLYADSLADHTTALQYMTTEGQPLSELFKPIAAASELSWK